MMIMIFNNIRGKLTVNLKLDGAPTISSIAG